MQGMRWDQALEAGATYTAALASGSALTDRTDESGISAWREARERGVIQLFLENLYGDLVWYHLTNFDPDRLRRPTANAMGQC